MVTKYKKGELALNILIVASVVFVIISIVLALTNANTYPYWILTVLYALYMIFSRNNYNFSTSGIMTLYVFMMFRYAILQFVTYVTGDQSSYVSNYYYMSAAIALMVYEEARK